jgi:hypothetical protein
MLGSQFSLLVLHLLLVLLIMVGSALDVHMDTTWHGHLGAGHSRHHWEASRPTHWHPLLFASFDHNFHRHLTLHTWHHHHLRTEKLWLISITWHGHMGHLIWSHGHLLLLLLLLGLIATLI